MTDPAPSSQAKAPARSCPQGSARGRRLATIIQGQGLIAMALLIGIYFGLSTQFFFTPGQRPDHRCDRGAARDHGPRPDVPDRQRRDRRQRRQCRRDHDGDRRPAHAGGLDFWPAAASRSRRGRRWIDQRDPRGRPDDQPVHRDARHAVGLPGPRVRGHRRPDDRRRRSDARLHRHRDSSACLSPSSCSSSRSSSP